MRGKRDAGSAARVGRRALHLDLTTARLFIAAVEQESLEEAARREGIAASAVSARIQGLEASLGVPLLRRHRRGVEATSVGLVVLRRARAMLNEARQLEADLNGLREGLGGRVRLCANEIAIVEFVPAILPDFVRTYPGVEVVLEERQSLSVARAVWDNAADLGIYVGDAPPVDLWRRPVFQDRLVLVLHRAHPLAADPAAGEATMADILDHDVVGQATEGALSTLLARAASAYHRVLRTHLFADGYDTVCGLVGHGLAVGIVSEGAALLFAPRFDLVVRPIADAWAVREHHVCARPPRTLEPAPGALLDHVLRAAERPRPTQPSPNAMADDRISAAFPARVALS